jgi:hypothetical protein
VISGVTKVSGAAAGRLGAGSEEMAGAGLGLETAGAGSEAETVGLGMVLETVGTGPWKLSGDWLGTGSVMVGTGTWKSNDVLGAGAAERAGGVVLSDGDAV